MPIVIGDELMMEISHKKSADNHNQISNRRMRIAFHYLIAKRYQYTVID